MYTRQFLAIVYGPAEAGAAAAIAAATDPASITRIDLVEGGLVLCRWDNEAVPRRGALVMIDGTGGAPAVALPRGLIDASLAPAGLLDIARQHASYLWLDEAGRLSAWTDHAANSPIYHARRGGCLLLSDDAALLAGPSPALDDGMIASFLVNGHMLRERTLFAGITSLPPASAGPIRSSGADLRRYWTFRPGADRWTDEAEMARELWSRIGASVLARAGDRHVLLPLSGGHDSPTLLGILHGAGVPVRTFSFVLGEPRPDSDAAVARAQAERLGVPHRVYRFEDGFSIVRMIEAHLDSGMFMRKPCYEFDVYGRAARDAAVGPDPVMMFGDEAFGQGTHPLGGDDNLIGSAPLKSPIETLSRLAPALPGPEIDRLGNALLDAYRGMLADIPISREREDARDVLYLENYLMANMVQMRRLIVAPLLPVAQPYLDLAVLDMSRHLPHQLRSDKTFFEALGRRTFPDIYRIGRARVTQAQPLIREEIPRQAAAIEEMIDRLGLAIPGVMTTAELQAALAQVRAGVPTVRSCHKALVEMAARHAVKRNLFPRPLVLAMRRRFWGHYRLGADGAVIFLRALHLAMACGRLAVASEARRPERSDVPDRLAV